MFLDVCGISTSREIWPRHTAESEPSIRKRPMSCVLQGTCHVVARAVVLAQAHVQALVPVEAGRARPVALLPLPARAAPARPSLGAADRPVPAGAAMGAVHAVGARRAGLLAGVPQPAGSAGAGTVDVVALRIVHAAARLLAASSGHPCRQSGVREGRCRLSLTKSVIWKGRASLSSCSQRGILNFESNTSVSL